MSYKKEEKEKKEELEPSLFVNLVMMDSTEKRIPIYKGKDVAFSLMKFCIFEGINDIALIEVLKRRVIRGVQRLEKLNKLSRDQVKKSHFKGVLQSAMSSVVNQQVHANPIPVNETMIDPSQRSIPYVKKTRTRSIGLTRKESIQSNNSLQFHPLRTRPSGSQKTLHNPSGARFHDLRSNTGMANYSLQSTTNQFNSTANQSPQSQEVKQNGPKFHIKENANHNNSSHSPDKNSVKEEAVEAITHALITLQRNSPFKNSNKKMRSRVVSKVKNPERQGPYTRKGAARTNKIDDFSGGRKIQKKGLIQSNKRHRRPALHRRSAEKWRALKRNSNALASSKNSNYVNSMTMNKTKVVAGGRKGSSVAMSYKKLLERLNISHKGQNDIKSPKNDMKKKGAQKPKKRQKQPKKHLQNHNQHRKGGGGSQSKHRHNNNKNHNYQKSRQIHKANNMRMIKKKLMKLSQPEPAGFEDQQLFSRKSNLYQLSKEKKDKLAKKMENRSTSRKERVKKKMKVSQQVEKASIGSLKNRVVKVNPAIAMLNTRKLSLNINSSNSRKIKIVDQERRDKVSKGSLKAATKYSLSPSRSKHSKISQSLLNKNESNTFIIDYDEAHRHQNLLPPTKKRKNMLQDSPKRKRSTASKRGKQTASQHSREIERFKKSLNHLKEEIKYAKKEIFKAKVRRSNDFAETHKGANRTKKPKIEENLSPEKAKRKTSGRNPEVNESADLEFLNKRSSKKDTNYMKKFLKRSAHKGSLAEMQKKKGPESPKIGNSSSKLQGGGGSTTRRSDNKTYRQDKTNSYSNSGWVPLDSQRSSKGKSARKKASELRLGGLPLPKPEPDNKIKNGGLTYRCRATHPQNEPSNQVKQHHKQKQSKVGIGSSQHSRGGITTPRGSKAPTDVDFYISGQAGPENREVMADSSRFTERKKSVSQKKKKLSTRTTSSQKQRIAEFKPGNTSKNPLSTTERKRSSQNKKFAYSRHNQKKKGKVKRRFSNSVRNSNQHLHFWPSQSSHLLSESQGPKRSSPRSFSKRLQNSNQDFSRYKKVGLKHTTTATTSTTSTTYGLRSPRQSSFQKTHNLQISELKTGRSERTAHDKAEVNKKLADEEIIKNQIEIQKNSPKLETLYQLARNLDAEEAKKSVKLSPSSEGFHPLARRLSKHLQKKFSKERRLDSIFSWIPSDKEERESLENLKKIDLSKIGKQGSIDFFGDKTISSFKSSFYFNDLGINKEKTKSELEPRFTISSKTSKQPHAQEGIDLSRESRRDRICRQRSILRLIFDMMDSDKDGYISNEKIDFSLVPLTVIEHLESVLFQVYKSKSQMGFEVFVRFVLENGKSYTKIEKVRKIDTKRRTDFRVFLSRQFFPSVIFFFFVFNFPELLIFGWVY